MDSRNIEQTFVDGRESPGMDERKRKKVAALVVTSLFFVVVNVCAWLGVLDSLEFKRPIDNVHYAPPYRVKNMRDYSAVYVDESTLFLVEKKPYHGSLRLGEEEVSNIVHFSKQCIKCETHRCPYNTTVLTIPLSRSGGITLTMYGFQKCRLPSRCVWYERYFSCSDLLSITDFTGAQEMATLPV